MLCSAREFPALEVTREQAMIRHRGPNNSMISRELINQNITVTLMDPFIGFSTVRIVISFLQPWV
jgi:hypothetical protein